MAWTTVYVAMRPIGSMYAIEESHADQQIERAKDGGPADAGMSGA